MLKTEIFLFQEKKVFCVLNAKINEVKGEIPNDTKLATAGENKIPSVGNSVKKLTITDKLMKLKIKLLIKIIINILQVPNLRGYSRNF